MKQAHMRDKKTGIIVLSYTQSRYITKAKRIKKNKGSYEKNSRNRLLMFLNSSPEYENTMRDTTKTKYNFKKINGLWE